MQLQEGKKYVNARGEHVHIIRYGDGAGYPFEDALGRTYTRRGKFMSDAVPHSNDLVCVCEEPVTPNGGIPYPEFESLLAVLATHQWSKIDEAVAALKGKHNLP